MHDTLLHGEALLIVATGNFEDVASELRADAVGGNFGAHTAVHEDAKLTLIFDLYQFLRTIGWVGNVELHLNGWRVVEMEESIMGRGRKSTVVLALDVFWLDDFRLAV